MLRCGTDLELKPRNVTMLRWGTDPELKPPHVAMLCSTLLFNFIDDNDFHEGVPTPKVGVHENGRIWTPRGHLSLGPPLDPPMDIGPFVGPVRWNLTQQLTIRKRVHCWNTCLHGTKNIWTSGVSRNTQYNGRTIEVPQAQAFLRLFTV